MTKLGHLINGIRIDREERTQDIYNPSVGEVAGQVGLASKTTVEEAVAAAEAAYPAWRDTPPAKRARIMFRFKQLLEDNADEIGRLIGQEHGKIVHDAQGELARGIENVEYACYAPELLKGEHSKNTGPSIDSWSEFQPLGVVAGITPFNFPAMVPLWMYPMAIACGNTFVLKPSERDPTSALYIAELAHEAGLPAGVLNVVNGDKEAVDALLDDPRVQAISFVGSTPIAEYIYSRASANGKRCQALGGAKNHAIVMPDADMDNVVSSLNGAAFGSSGERCMALSVAVAVGDEAADNLIAKMQEQMQSLKVGPFSDKSNDFGPVITKAHQEKVCGYIDSAEQQGAKIVVDGRGVQVPSYENGFYVGGTLIDQVSPDMTCYQEEIFGPVLLVMRVSSMDEAMKLINDHEYGNGTCIYTRDGEAARYFSDRIKVGMVGINVPLPVPVSYHSFGGWKRSLFGDLSAYGPDAVRFYTRRKTITQRWPSAGVREGAQFSFPS
ncbi:methylmalonate-semialdehyde dehydrogenase (acylating) [Vreelandella aquamarina]|mgnify:FL=1|jgi:malonate-semialdehyde dehydrogenase (acetylating)/methylmalonate-semialdehyde dehydrogenase|uniref:methylmalonate-semialdehyde dehydrogenase (CoA acylating) n=1 Tax=Vreelandella aquamarina TaxID=77097 RepID=A0A1N6CYT1_9GAMM|nr:MULTISPECIES: CoA-acylating methylmalonate-semialdehyde dehydrogenase [Halomonas]HBN60458.1 methylmalonate-semialdehyde dehydrogenase (CoA acylating) [Halomonas sp.]SIN63748.1 methylmalonate-semialdehyde dehydrogenase [acylating] [Halomonas meridiana]SIN72319.1 methylmalonate-semialdehyde dehydrogenase [acylating] [Halomonas meridiana]SIO42135.1 methylmalonate-semialdehyde dehydrogenase [acylating] [Halomonas meridiana]GED47339.1 methylmalonate-semialdehyde dehydrogenase (acylating) [Halomo|tara:strand:- start:707 stop:2197 length:1491 start_codon:yes stop_codon:yes gene_type:complete